MANLGNGLYGPPAPIPNITSSAPLLTPLIGALGPATIAGGLSLAGSMMQASANKDTFKNQRRWEAKKMQNAHQWQVEDLRAAGLNPILSSTLGGARGGSIGGGQMPDIATNAVSTALQARRLTQDLKNAQEAEKNIKADTQLKNMQTNQASAQALLNRTRAYQSEQDRNTGLSQQKLNEVNELLAQLKLPEAEQIAKIYKSEHAFLAAVTAKLGSPVAQLLSSSFGILGIPIRALFRAPLNTMPNAGPKPSPTGPRSSGGGQRYRKTR